MPPPVSMYPTTTADPVYAIGNPRAGAGGRLGCPRRRRAQVAILSSCRWSARPGGRARGEGILVDGLDQLVSGSVPGEQPQRARGSGLASRRPHARRPRPAAEACERDRPPGGGEQSPPSRGNQATGRSPGQAAGCGGVGRRCGRCRGGTGRGDLSWAPRRCSHGVMAQRTITHHGDRTGQSQDGKREFLSRVERLRILSSQV
jgi:hypothetical protein